MKWKWLSYFLVSNLLTIFICIVSLLVLSGFSHGIKPLGEAFRHISLSPDGIGQLLVVGFVLIVGSVAAVLVAPWAGVMFTTRLSEQLRSISWGAESLSKGDLSYRMPHSSEPELQSISESFNYMAERIQSQVMALQKLVEENTRLSEQASETAVLEERRRLARDLHDAVSQQLFSINMSLSAASRMMEKKPKDAQEQVEFAKDMAAKAQGEMRALLMHLRPVALDERSFKEAAEALLAEVRNKNNLQCEIAIQQLDMPRGLEDNLFRILQEAVANIIKHASATRMKVEFSKSENRIYMAVEDNGIGISKDPQSQTSYGLRGIEERTGKIGGSVRWLSIPGKGTRIEVRVPISGGDFVEPDTSSPR